MTAISEGFDCYGFYDEHLQIEDDCEEISVDQPKQLSAIK
jgi:hypothetical protein